jgi:long-chain acyl-CoA synthetase
VAPDKVENIYLGCSLVSEVFVHGESTHNFAIAIVTGNRDGLLHLAESKGIKGSYEEICRNMEMRTMVLI